MSYFTVTKVFLGLEPIFMTGLKYWLTVKFLQAFFFYFQTVQWKYKLVKHRVIGLLLRRHRLIKEGCADLHTPDMSRFKWVWHYLHTVMLWEFFLLYLSLFKVIPETEYLISWLQKKSLKQILFDQGIFSEPLVFNDIYFLERTSVFVL